MILIKGARVADPERLVLYEGDIVLEGDRIAGIGTYEDDGSYDSVIDASGLTAAPGLVDVHVHFRDPGLTYKEDILTGAAAAAAGGYTTVVCMANTKPAIDNADTLEYVLAKGRETGIHVLAAAAVSMGLSGKETVPMEALAAAGACGFTDDGKPVTDAALLREALERAAALHLPVSLHEEDPSLIRQSGINHGAAAESLGLYGAPAAAETSLTARDCMLALDTGAAIHIQHVSSADTVSLIRAMKGIGVPVTAEVTPHHFTLTEEAVTEKGTLAKMNPPLRGERDRLALIRGLQDGTIDMIATDHAPHSAEEKDRPFTEAPSGIIGLETALALGITELVEKRYLTLPELMAKMSLNPARLYHLECGRMEAGAPADLVLFDPEEKWTAGRFRSRSANSPFIGRELKGRVKYTICGGNIIYRDL